MKNLSKFKGMMFIFAMVLSLTSLKAQSPYETAMAEQIDLSEKIQTVEQLTPVIGSFIQISKEYPNHWEPYYYVAHNSVMQGFMNNTASVETLEELANQAEEYLKKAEKISPENVEIYVLKCRISALRMKADKKYYQTEGKLYSENLKKAKSLNPNNPRVLLLEAEAVYHTPKEYGGNKEVALKLFEKSLNEFQKEEDRNKIKPHWGKNEVNYFLSLK